jgi:enterochelin esterase-like enzyme
LLLRPAAPSLRKIGTYFWFYSGSTDRFREQNAAFAHQLSALHVPYSYRIVVGGHNWAIWRANAALAYLAAATRLAHG